MFTKPRPLLSIYFSRGNSMPRGTGSVMPSSTTMKLTVTNHEEQARQDRGYWRSRTPEERLDEVEKLRIEAGKFLYEYPCDHNTQLAC